MSNAPISSQVIEALQRHYELGEVTKAEAIASLGENHNTLLSTEKESFFVKLNNMSYHTHLAPWTTGLQKWLVGQGMKECIEPTPAKDGSLYLTIPEHGTAIVYPNRPGFVAEIENSEAEERSGQQLAQWIARLHKLSSQVPSFGGKPKSSFQEGMKFLQDHFPLVEGLAGLLPTLPLDEEFQSLCQLFFSRIQHYHDALFEDNRVYKLFETTAKQATLTHGDLNRSNLSFSDDGKLMTVYDFDESGWDHRAADLQFLYYHYYQPSSLEGKDSLDESNYKRALDAYEQECGLPISTPERQLCAMLGMRSTLRGLMWCFTHLVQGTLTEPLLLCVDRRARPTRFDEPGTTQYQTFGKLIHATESFYQQYLNLCS